jgi:hypothetical protein
MNHRVLAQEVYESGALHDMVGVPRPQPPSQPNANGVDKFDISDIYPQGDGSDVGPSDHSGSGSDGEDDNEGESRYRMRSSRPPPAKRRKPDVYEAYMTDDDYE